MLRYSSFIFFIIFTASCFSKTLLASDKQAVVIAIDQTPTSLLPFSDEAQMSQQFRHLFFDPLFRWNKTNEIENRLVKKWFRINEKTIRFQLRENIKFHSGNELTAKDVVWSFEQAKEHQSTSHQNRLFTSVESISSYGKMSIDISSRLPRLQLFDYLSTLFILDSSFYRKNNSLLNKSVKKMSASIKDLPLSGTGPYMVNKYNPLLGIEVKVNSSYWSEEPEVKLIRFMKIHKAKSRLFALLANDVEVSYAIPHKNIKDVSKNLEKKLIKIPSSKALFLTVNDKLSSELKNRQLREALRLAIDQQGILQHILNGNGRTSSSINALFKTQYVASQKASLTKRTKSLNYNLKKSKALLKGIKLPSNLSLLVMVNDSAINEEVAKVLSKMFSKIGINLVIQKVNSKEIWDNTNLYYDLTLSNWSTHFVDRHNIEEDLFTNSLIKKYLQDKLNNRVDKSAYDRSKYLDQLQGNNWLIPLFFQDKIWAESGELNLEDIFSVNEIPYWSLLKSEKEK